MSAAVRVETVVWGDWRFRALATALGCDWHGAIGRCVHLWGECTRRGSYTLPTAAIGAILGTDPADAVAALVSCELAEETPDGVRIRGTEGRIEWLEAKQRAGRKGGRVRATKASRTRGQFVSELTPSQTETRHPSSRNKAQVTNETHHDGVLPSNVSELTPSQTDTRQEPDRHQTGARQTPDRSQAETRPTTTTTTTTRERVSAVADLVAARKRAKRSQQDLAKALLVGNAQVSRWERGLDPMPDGYRRRWEEMVARWDEGPARERADFRAHFCDAFMAAAGRAYVWQGARDNAHTQALVLELGLAAAKQRADNMFQHQRHGWPASADLGTLRQHVNKFAAPPQRGRGQGLVASRAEHEHDRQRGGKF